jgi:hypothetical protein
MEYLMKNESARLQTFHGWPYAVASPSALARAGFYWTKTRDIVKCAFCSGSVGKFETGDVPWLEHERLYPECPFIRGYPVGNVAPVVEGGSREVVDGSCIRGSTVTSDGSQSKPAAATAGGDEKKKPPPPLSTTVFKKMVISTCPFLYCPWQRPPDVIQRELQTGTIRASCIRGSTSSTTTTTAAAAEKEETIIYTRCPFRFCPWQP